jgi:hypothetical protein
MPMTREQLLQMQASGRVYQERYDNALAPWDQRAPAPVLGQSIDDYRRDTLVKIKKLLPRGHELRKVKVYELRNDVIDVLEPQLLKACRTEAYNADSVPPGEMRRVVEVDQGGTKIVRWIGQESFVKEMGRPGRRVVSFRTDQGFVDASGRALR